MGFARGLTDYLLLKQATYTGGCGTMGEYKERLAASEYLLLSPTPHCPPPQAYGSI